VSLLLFLFFLLSAQNGRCVAQTGDEVKSGFATFLYYQET